MLSALSVPLNEKFVLIITVTGLLKVNLYSRVGIRFMLADAAIIQVNSMARTVLLSFPPLNLFLSKWCRHAICGPNPLVSIRYFRSLEGI